MRIETLCTGDELLTGLTADTNSRFFQQQLLDGLGLTVRRSVVVGDDVADIAEAIEAAIARCDVLLVSGGLGPTSDDVTVEAAARAAGVAVELNPAVLAHVEQRAKARGVPMNELNRLQARVPAGAEAVLNAEGSAPLIIQTRGACTLFFVPGVPKEYRHLVQSHVIARIAALRGPGEIRRLALLKTVGVPESQLDLRTRHLQARHPDVTFGFRTHPPENQLKLLARAPTETLALERLEAAVSDAQASLGTAVFARDEQTMGSVVLETLRAKRQTLALAESCSGGLMASLLTDVPGMSEVLFGAAVTYQAEAKTRWAWVSRQVLDEAKEVSAPTAVAMAEGVRAQARSSWGLSTTGYAGPTGGDERWPVGTVFIGLAGPEGTRVERHHFVGDRLRIKHFAAFAGLDLLRRTAGGLS